MKVLILAGGYGTRLYAVTKDTPKPLLDISGKPLINYLTEKIQNASDLSEVIVVTNHKFYDTFQDWAKENADFPAPIVVINDGTTSPENRLGSVGDMQYVLQQHNIDEDLLVLGGDNLFDYALDEFIVFAQEKAPAVTIGLYDIGSLENASLFGVVELGDDGRIKIFEEKPENPRSTLIAMCSYYFPKDSLGLIDEYIRETNRTDKAGDYIRWLVEKGCVYGFQFNGTWYDIGSPESLKEAQEKFKT